MPQEIFRRESLNSDVFKILVIGPNGDSEVKGESEQFGVIGVTAADSIERFGHAFGVSRWLDNGHRQSGDGEQHHVGTQAFFSGQNQGVLFDLAKGRSGSQYFLDLRIRENKCGASTDYSRQQHISVGD
jgi:hypothetical protein